MPIQEFCRHEHAVDSWLHYDHGNEVDLTTWGTIREREISDLRYMWRGTSDRHGARELRRLQLVDTTETTFNALAVEWRGATMHLSSIGAKVAHPAYLRIIGLGPVALPLVLKRLETEPGFWFAALRALSGHNPVPNDAAGNVRRMRDAWLSWGRERGLI